jgi:uncharacterized repeat protein (TIGR04138 family)
MELDAERTEKIDEILERDSRYRAEAYVFVLEALAFTVQRAGRMGHVSAAELLAGIRDHALEQYGMMAKTVLNLWGIQRSSQFGDLVWNLIDVELLGKRPEDQREDFDAASFDIDTELVDRNP